MRNWSTETLGPACTTRILKCSSIIIGFVLFFQFLQSPLPIRKLIEQHAVRLRRQSSVRFSTGSAALCRRTSASSDAIDWSFCQSIIKGELTQQRIEKSASMRVTWQPSTLDNYMQCASDCDRFRSELGYLTSTDDLSEEELELPLAFSILMYEQFEQVERLLRLIYRPHNFYCIHVDGNAPPLMHDAAKSVASCLPNVIVANPPVRVTYATISIVDAEMLCIEQLLALSGDWKYFINLVGKDFPLKTNVELVRILKSLRGANDIDGSSTGHSGPHRVQFVWRNGEQTAEPKDAVPYNLTLSKGNTHIAARREFVEFALHDLRAREFRHWLRDTQIPDETFFNSLNRNPQLMIPGTYTGTQEPTIVNHEKRWSFEDPRKHCAGRWIRWICSVSIGDLHWVISSPRMFLNKIRIELDPVAYRCLELWYADRVRSELSFTAANGSHPLNLTVYESQDYVKNHI